MSYLLPDVQSVTQYYALNYVYTLRCPFLEHAFTPPVPSSAPSNNRLDTMSAELHKIQSRAGLIFDKYLHFLNIL